MSTNLLIGLVVIIAAVAGYLYHRGQQDDVKIELPGNNDVEIQQ